MQNIKKMFFFPGHHPRKQGVQFAYTPGKRVCNFGEHGWAKHRERASGLPLLSPPPPLDSTLSPVSSSHPTKATTHEHQWRRQRMFGGAPAEAYMMGDGILTAPKKLK